MAAATLNSKIAYVKGIFSFSRYSVAPSPKTITGDSHLNVSPIAFTGEERQASSNHAIGS